MRISDWSSDVCSSDLVGLRCIARGRVAREARGDDQLGAGAQQFQAGLVADLDAAAGEQRNAAAQGGGLGALDDWERVVEGKGVSVRGVLGGRRITNKKKQFIRSAKHAHYSQ